MALEAGRWLKLNPGTIESVPASAGVFEIGNLVRSVLYIGRGDGNLRTRLESLGAVPANVPASSGGYYVRYWVSPDEEVAVIERQTAHRTEHDGHLPPGNEARPRPSFRLIVRRAA